MPMAVTEMTAPLAAPVSTLPCTATSQLPHAPTADTVIVQLLWMSNVSVKVVMPMAVMEESPLLAAPLSTVPCTATSHLPHAPTADAVIVQLLWMSNMFVQVVMPMAVMEETAAFAAPAMTPRCLTMPKCTHARKGNAVIVAMLPIRHTFRKGPAVTTVTGEA